MEVENNEVTKEEVSGVLLSEVTDVLASTEVSKDVADILPVEIKERE